MNEMTGNSYGFAKIQRTLSYEVVVDQIRALIDSGDLQPGDRLPPERDLSLRLSVSRATLREAFRVLELNGLVETRLGQGRFVAELKPADASHALTSEALEEAAIFDFIEVRRSLDVSMAGTAAERATSEDIVRLGASLDALQRSVPGESNLNTDFDLALARASHNAVYSRFVSSELFLLCKLATTTALLPRRRDGMIQEHRDILEAVRRHDAEAARAAMLRHVNNLEHALHHSLSERGRALTPQSPSV